MAQTRPRPSKASPRWQGEVANAAALPTTGNRVADVRVAKDTFIPWIWNGTAWQNLASPVGALNYKGVWDATNPPAGGNPTLADGVGTKGDYYVVSGAGIQDLGSGPLDFNPADWVVYNGTIWEKADHTDVVASVFGRLGAVVAAASDYDASQVDNDSGVAGATVKDALDTLDGACADVSCSAYRTTTQSVNDSALTPISLDAEEFDTDTMHDPGVNPSRITVPAGEAGKYLAIARLSWAGNITGLRAVILYINGALHTASYVNPVGIFSTIVAVSKVLNLSVGDYVEMYGYQTSGAALNTVAGAIWNHLQLVKQRG